MFCEKFYGNDLLNKSLCKNEFPVYKTQDCVEDEVHSNRPSTRVLEENSLCSCPNQRGATINSRKKSEHYTFLNWFSFHKSDWKTEVEQVFCLMDAKAVASKSGVDKSRCSGGDFK